MIAGINKLFEHSGRSFHIQAEDLGVAKACFEVKLFESGTILWLKRLPYDQILSQDIPEIDKELAIKAHIDRAIRTVELAISRGRFG